MVLGVEKRVRAEQGDVLLSRDEKTGRALVPKILIIGLIVVIVGGLFVTLVQYMIGEQFNTLRMQMTAMEAQSSRSSLALQERVDSMEASLQERIAGLEGMPSQVEAMLLDSTLSNMAQQVEQLRARQSYAPQVQEKLGEMERLLAEMRQGQ